MPVYRLWEWLRQFFGRIRDDILNLRNYEIYIVATATFLFTFLSLFGQLPPWLAEHEQTLIVASLGLLVFNISIPKSRKMSIDDVFDDRSDLRSVSFENRIKNKNVLWIQGASAVNILSQANVLAIREHILSKDIGEFKVIIQNPEEHEALELLVRQLDESVDIKIQEMEQSLNTSIKTLKGIEAWGKPGDFAYGFLPYSPGFSMIAINPHEFNGLIIVEIYGFHNKSTESRMNFQIRRTDSETWYNYWVHQFEYMWEKSEIQSAPVSDD